jgi:hypothetical protein
MRCYHTPDGTRFEELSMDTELPEELEKLHALGEPTAEFTLADRQVTLRLLGGGALFLGGVALLGAAVVLIYYMATHRGKLRGIKGVFLLAMGGIALVSAGILFPLRAIRNRGLRVLVYPEGLVRAQGERVETLRWEEVETLHRSFSPGIWNRVLEGSIRYTVRRKDGMSLTFDSSLPAVAELGALLERESLRCLLPDCMQSYDAGEVIGFDPLRVSVDGISHDKSVLPWSQIKEIAIDDKGQLVIKKQGAWFSSAWYTGPASAIANVHVFLALANHAQGRDVN